MAFSWRRWGRRYRVGKYLPRPRIELRAPACACGYACIQNRPGDDKRPGGVASFNPGIPSFDDGPARSQKPSLVTSTLVPKLTPPRPRSPLSFLRASSPFDSTVAPWKPLSLGHRAMGGWKRVASHRRAGNVLFRLIV